MIEENIIAIREKLPPGVKLVAVSKFHPEEAIREAYAAGQRVFGENRPQESARRLLLLTRGCAVAIATPAPSPWRGCRG
jgi:uncharacterized pyridoxal phosphate-containing UPF0001 family protein